jgi:hypothetical protein
VSHHLYALAQAAITSFVIHTSSFPFSDHPTPSAMGTWACDGKRLTPLNSPSDSGLTAQPFASARCCERVFRTNAHRRIRRALLARYLSHLYHALISRVTIIYSFSPHLSSYPFLSVWVYRWRLKYSCLTSVHRTQTVDRGPPSRERLFLTQSERRFRQSFSPVVLRSFRLNLESTLRVYHYFIRIARNLGRKRKGSAFGDCRTSRTFIPYSLSSNYSPRPRRSDLVPFDGVWKSWHRRRRVKGTTATAWIQILLSYDCLVQGSVFKWLRQCHR